ncbi:hypothetical protein AQUCO_02600330v1 [Aquilegia coerulea]|uniref:FBD domain-containing protein n=1 Tax=Aquilegia coerulea TaxID=218851 RepID=A0A2G5D8E7_AQUCA|nr:hypothetical protein AQUCO_02600330v1 [Aquilegia coerulea]
MMKKQKNSSCSPEEQNIDTISNLPEGGIRNHIVSFLPMQDAIKTSILSKEWRKVCSSLTNMTFDQKYFQRKYKSRFIFKDIVDQTLKYHDESDIQKFKLLIMCGNGSSPPHIPAWISFALCHNVRELELEFCYDVQELRLDLFDDVLRELELGLCHDDQEVELGFYEFPVIKFPCGLFTCRTLRVLKLSTMRVELPKLIEFPMLNTLKLLYVEFDNDNPINQFISSCPVLEDFFMSVCSWYSEPLIDISAPNLKALNLCLLGNAPTSGVKISAPNLRLIYYSGGDPPDISSETLSSLHEAKFLFQLHGENERDQDIAHHATKIFKGLHNIRKLDLHCYYIEALPSNIPARYLPPQDPSTKSILMHLKEVVIRYFEGSESEVDLVRYLLNNAIVMEEIKIGYAKEIKDDAESQRIIAEKILAFNKGSPSAVISFSMYC